MPAALAFMADRRAARGAKIEVRPFGGSLRVAYAEPDRALTADVALKVLRPRGVLLRAQDKRTYNPATGDFVVVQVAPPAAATLQVSLHRYTDNENVLSENVLLVGGAGKLVELAVEIRRHPDGKVVAKRRASVSSRQPAA